MSSPTDYLNLSELRRLDEIRADLEKLKRSVVHLNAEKRVIRRRGAARRDAAIAGGRV